MHPVLLSLANTNTGVHMKATSHSFALAGYIPTPKFEDVFREVATVLTNSLYHTCIDIITENLKRAEKTVVILDDPNGNEWICHTLLVSWIADLSEQRMQACIMNNQSPVTLATLKQFGDKNPHPWRTRAHTLNLIEEACMNVKL